MLGLIKHSLLRVCLVRIGCGATSLANDLPAKTNSRFSSPLIHIRTQTHTFYLLTPHNGMTVSAAPNRHLPIALRSSLLLNTGAHKRWAEFSLQQIFALQRESANEVCQRASLTPNSQKTTGTWCAPGLWWVRQREDKRKGKEAELELSSGSKAPLSYENCIPLHTTQTSALYLHLHIQTEWQR